MTKSKLLKMKDVVPQYAFDTFGVKMTIEQILKIGEKALIFLELENQTYVDTKRLDEEIQKNLTVPKSRPEKTVRQVTATKNRRLSLIAMNTLLDVIDEPKVQQSLSKNVSSDQEVKDTLYRLKKNDKATVAFVKTFLQNRLENDPSFKMKRGNPSPQNEYPDLGNVLDEALEDKVD